ncbi:MAG: GNAT family N-acetyltransferase [Candidatus Promineifilaceae bacterium]
MNPAIAYEVNLPVSAAAVAEVFRDSGLSRPVADLARIQRMLDNADVTVTAWDGERLVGVGRALTDFSFCCYLSDLAVARAYQRQGIGREIVAQVQAVIGEESMLLLLATPLAMSYYPHLGFESQDRAWMIPRRR